MERGYEPKIKTEIWMQYAQADICSYNRNNMSVANAHAHLNKVLECTTEHVVYLRLLSGTDKLPRSDKAGRPWLPAGLGPARGSDGGATGVSSIPSMRSSGGGASSSSSGGAPTRTHTGV